MLQLNNCEIKRLFAHYVGNKSKGEKLQFTEKEVQIKGDGTEALLRTYFLNKFKSLGEEYQLPGVQTDDIFPIRDAADKLFKSKEAYFETSKKLAEHLFECSDHPNIKAGEFFLLHLDNVMYGHEYVDAFGIFKSETKESFLKINNSSNDAFIISGEQGINLYKLDKGCIVFNVQKEDGYRMRMIDNTNKNDEAHYWKHDFLQALPVPSEKAATEHFMGLVKEYSNDFLCAENQHPREEQIDFLHKTSNYMQNRQAMNIKDFKEEVIIEPEASDAFDTYTQDYSEKTNYPITDNFQIAQDIVNSKAKKYFRSVIKLDKNFHVYIHGNRNNVEKGFDEEKQLGYYKLYFSQEN